MVEHCQTLNEVDPIFENAGCYRILGDIFAKAPSFSANPEHISQDLEKSADYLKQAVQLAPHYALNHLFLARSLAELGEKSEAQAQLKEFDRLNSSDLDKVYPEWKKDREELVRDLQ
jgi:tetratricopeptide (TPR) repeat protein